MFRSAATDDRLKSDDFCTYRSNLPGPQALQTGSDPYDVTKKTHTIARAVGLLTAAYAATRSMVIALTILSRNLLAVVVVALMITIRFACERTRRNVYIYASVPSFRLLFSAYYAFSPVSVSLCSYA